MKAFRISSFARPELGALVVFACSALEAADLQRAEAYGPAIEIERDVAFDAYSPGPIPVDALVAEGWILSAEELAAGAL